MFSARAEASMKNCLRCNRPVTDQHGDAFDSNLCWWHTASSPKPLIQLVLLLAFLCCIATIS